MGVKVPLESIDPIDVAGALETPIPQILNPNPTGGIHPVDGTGALVYPKPYPITSEHVIYDILLKFLDSPNSNMVRAISLVLAHSESCFKF